MPGNSGNIDSFDLREYLDCFLIVIKKCPMSLCCELPKEMHSRDKVQLTGMHDRQELDWS